MVARTLGGAPTLADAIVEQLFKPTDKASSTRTEPGPQSEQEASEMAATIWNEAIWPVERLRQRIFFNFGMEVRSSINLALYMTGLISFLLPSPRHPKLLRQIPKGYCDSWWYQHQAQVGCVRNFAAALRSSAILR